MRLEPRPFGRTGLRATPLGLACNFGIDAEGVERAWLDHGVSYFFVTQRASAGVEGIRRLVAGGHRDRIVIASGASVPFGWSVRREWEKSARALGVDVIDVFHLFWVQAHWYVTGNTWKEMQKLKEEGKVRALAISIHDRKMATRLAGELGLDALMIRYNAAHRGAEREIFEPLEGPNRPAMIAYTATRWGKLLEAKGGRGPMTAAECYRFALGHPAVSTVLCGPRSREELAEDVAGVLEGPLPQARLEEVRAFGDVVRGGLASSLAYGS